MAAMPASVQGQAARMLCLLVIIAIHAPSCTPVFVEAASGSAEEGTRQLSPCFVPALSIHHNRLAAFSCPAAAFRTTLDRLYAPAAFPIQERGRMLRSRHVLRRLSDKDKQDMPQEDRAKEEEAAKKEEEEKEVFWMFETEKNFREELKAPTLLRVEFDNYDVEFREKYTDERARTDFVAPVAGACEVGTELPIRGRYAHAFVRRMRCPTLISCMLRSSAACAAAHGPAHGRWLRCLVQ
eukprot:965994-Rhodomonas_salina.2